MKDVPTVKVCDFGVAKLTLGGVQGGSWPFGYLESRGVGKGAKVRVLPGSLCFYCLRFFFFFSSSSLLLLPPSSSPSSPSSSFSFSSCLSSCWLSVV